MSRHVSSAVQSGVGLLEVLIALLILSVGLLGMAGMIIRSQQAEMESYQRAQALILLEDMAARLVANRSGKTCYVSTPPEVPYLLGSASTFTGTGCDALASADLLAWSNLLKGSAETKGGADVGAMVGARGCITGGGNSYVVTVAWQGLSPTVAPADQCGAGLYGADAQRRVVSRTVRFANLK